MPQACNIQGAMHIGTSTHFGFERNHIDIPFVNRLSGALTPADQVQA